MDGDLLRHPFVVRRRLDVDEYHRMGEAGILGPEDRVELIEGELIAMAPIGPLHSGGSVDLTTLLVEAVRGLASVSVGNPVRLDRYNEPQPDFALLRRREGSWRGHVVTPEDVLLLIELSDSSLRFDRRVKLPLYGSHGIVEYWILNLQKRCVEVCRGPRANGYASVVRHAPGVTLSPEALPDVVLRVIDLVGEA